MLVFPILSALVSGVFAWQVGKQYRQRRKPHQAAWTFALFLACAASLAYALSVAFDQAFFFRLFALLGGFLMAAYLGLGSIYLRFGERVGAPVAAVLIAATIYAAWHALFAAPIDLEALAALDGGSGRGILMVEGFPMALRIALNVFGAVSVFGVALLSAFSARTMGRAYVGGNLLLALGVLFVSGAGSSTRLGGFEGFDAFWAGKTAGIILLHLGFIAINRALAGQRPAESASLPAS